MAAGHLNTTHLDRRRLLAAGAALLASAGTGIAQTRNRPLLTVVYPSGETTTFDEAGLAELSWGEIATHTRWTEGRQLFRGPYLSEVLMQGGGTRSEIEGRDLLMVALNEFQVTVPARDAWQYNPILAREMNGVPMRVRDKGPLWLVYPRDDEPALQNPLIDERWIWQVTTITIL